MREIKFRAWQEGRYINADCLAFEEYAPLIDLLNDERNILAHFLYCLDQLGDKLVIKSFQGNFKSDFRKIEIERKRIMEGSEIYKAFKKRE